MASSKIHVQAREGLRTWGRPFRLRIRLRRGGGADVLRSMTLAEQNRAVNSLRHDRPAAIPLPYPSRAAVSAVDALLGMARSRLFDAVLIGVPRKASGTGKLVAFHQFIGQLFLASVR